MVMKMFSPLVIILVVLICSESGQTQEDWIIKLKETLVTMRQFIQLVQKFNKEPCEYYCAHGGVCILNPEPTCQCAGAWKGERCDDNPCKDVSCNTGTCYADGNGLPHCVCPCGTSGQFCEIEDRCLQVETILNGQVHVDTKMEVTATYTCENNYNLCGPLNSTCALGTEQSRTYPVCIEPYAGNTNYDVSFGDSMYYFSGDKTGKTFKDAQEFCKDHGGNLLSVNSADEWKFVQCVLSQEARLPGGVARWLGLLKSNETWTWTSGEPLTVSYWHNNHKTDPYKCGFMTFDEWRAAIECDNKAKFICEINYR